MTTRWLMLVLLVAAAAGPVCAQESPPVAPAPPGNAAAETPAPPPGSSPPSEVESLREQVRTLQQRMEEIEKEAEARRALRVTEEEKSATEKEILTAVGREYALIPRHAFNFEYGLAYSYFSSDILQDLRNTTGGLAAERRGNHTFTHTLTTEYGLRDNLSVNFTLPLVETWLKRSGAEDLDVTDLGDINLGFQLQPLKEREAWPATILFVNGSVPLGRSPYKINPNTELATGNGYYSLSGGLSLSKSFDPVVAFGSLVYTHPFATSDTSQPSSGGGRALDRVEAGDRLGFAMGLAFAMSYRTSMSFTYQYNYRFESKYTFTDGTQFESNSYVTSSFGIGAGWRISPRYSLYLRVDIGLTNDDPDFTFSIRIPVRFYAGS